MSSFHPLVFQICYRISVEGQSLVTREFPPVVFKQLDARDGIVRVRASVTHAAKPAFVFAIRKHGGTVADESPVQ